MKAGFMNRVLAAAWPSVGLRHLIPLIALVVIGATATPSAYCAASDRAARCSCGGSASIGRAMDSASLVAIAVVDTTGGIPAGPDARIWPLRIERAWRWPGDGAAPPRQVVVAERPVANACAVTMRAGETQLVVAYLRASDGALVLGHKCATPWGAMDTLGPTARDARRFGGDRVVLSMGRDQAARLDSLLTYGPGATPKP
jgi:hypothetical protein